MEIFESYFWNFREVRFVRAVENPMKEVITRSGNDWLKSIGVEPPFAAMELVAMVPARLYRDDVYYALFRVEGLTTPYVSWFVRSNGGCHGGHYDDSRSCALSNLLDRARNALDSALKELKEKN